MVLVRIVLLVRAGHCIFIVEKLRNLAGGGSDGAALGNNDCLARIGHIGDNASRIGLGASAMSE